MSDARHLPDFIIAGAAKSATTWLQHSLQQSPQITMPSHEPHFFSRRYEEGIDAYLEELGEASPRTVLGEKSNSYLTAPEAAARIRRHVPDVRLIFQLRDPVARAYSDYLMLFRRGEVDANISHHLDPDKSASGRFLNDGRYADHMQRFYDLFPAEQILVLRYEDIKRDPVRQLAQCSAHLGLREVLALPIEGRIKDSRAAVVPRPLRRMLAPFRPLVDPIRNTAAVSTLRNLVARPVKYPDFDEKLRAELSAFYRPQIARLEAMTGKQFTAWPDA